MHVIPAKAGIPFVAPYLIPAKAGIPIFIALALRFPLSREFELGATKEIPAFAGMTGAFAGMTGDALEIT